MSKKLSTKLAIAVVGASVLSGTAAVDSAVAKTILLQDNFDSEGNGQIRLDYDDLENWNVTDGNVDLIGNGEFGFNSKSGMYLDLDGSQRNAGRIESKGEYRFTEGDTVELKFDLLGINDYSPLYVGDDEVTVSLGDLFKETFSAEDFGLTGKGPTVSVKRTIKVESPTTAKLVFDHAGGDLGGLLLDNVELSVTPYQVEEAESVPEPASMLGLLAVGVAGCASVKRKKSS